MERIEQPGLSSRTWGITFRFPLYVWVVIVVLTGSTMLVTGIMMAAQRELSSPFSGFGDLFGNDVKQAVLAHGFTCGDAALDDQAKTVSGQCVQHNTDKMFSKIYLQVSGSIANEISFSLHKNTLRLGDFAALWGKPEMRQYCETLVASWPNSHMMAIVTPPRNGQFSYFSPLITVTFTRDGSPRWVGVLMNDVLHNCE